MLSAIMVVSKMPLLTANTTILSKKRGTSARPPARIAKQFLLAKHYAVAKFPIS